MAEETIKLDKVVVAHLEDMDKIEDAADEDIEKAYQSLDIDRLIEDPQVELQRVTGVVSQVLETKHFPEAAKNGLEFAEVIKKQKKIEIPDSDDPNLNLENSDEVFGDDFNQGRQD